MLTVVERKLLGLEAPVAGRLDHAHLPAGQSRTKHLGLDVGHVHLARLELEAGRGRGRQAGRGRQEGNREQPGGRAGERRAQAQPPCPRSTQTLPRCV